MNALMDFNCGLRVRGWFFYIVFVCSFFPVVFFSFGFVMYIFHVCKVYSFFLSPLNISYKESTLFTRYQWNTNANQTTYENHLDNIAFLLPLLISHFIRIALLKFLSWVPIRLIVQCSIERFIVNAHIQYKPYIHHRNGDWPRVAIEWEGVGMIEKMLSSNNQAKSTHKNNFEMK